ncbi:MAG: winged helix-turn-helix domain-containing protein [Planctomycetales bacterium]|nr:winged helix-turn-helix domain-containing protein [Planctomycetales bacterium]
MAKKKAVRASKTKALAESDVVSAKVTPNGAAKQSNGAAEKSNGAAEKTNGAAKKASESRRVFDDSAIGLVAGEVWQTLDQGGEQTLTGVKKKVEAPGDLVTAAVGWLARENKLRFVQSGRTTKVTLR